KPSEVARRLSEQRARFGWIEEIAPVEVARALAPDEAKELLELTQKIAQAPPMLPGWLPDVRRVPDPKAFSKIVREERAAAAQFEAKQSAELTPIATTLARATRTERKALREKLIQYLQARERLRRLGYSWVEVALQDVTDGRRSTWMGILEAGRELLPGLRERAVGSDAVKVEGAGERPDALVLEDARVILRHLRSGGGWGVPGLRPRVLRDRRYLLRTTVNGRRLDSLSMVEKFVEVLETREALTRMWNLWNGFVEAASETRERAVLRL